MKKTTIILFAFLAFAVSLRAADGISERTLLSTDRTVYVAGDRVWMSAFCMDAQTGRLSTFSSVAYVELHSAEGMVQTAKIALAAGRGAGVLTLPKNLPTGNYRLIAYTALNKNEDGFDWGACGRILSVLNPATSAKVDGGVEIVDEAGYAHPARIPQAGGLDVKLSGVPSRSGVLPLTLDYAGASPATVSVSVWHDDGLAPPCNFDIAAQLGALKPGNAFTSKVIPEYEGEIIYGKVVGADSTTVEGSYGFIAAPGDKSDVYSASVEADGSVVFFTNNIYGDKDLVCQIEKREGLPGYLELSNPFVNAPVGEGIPSLQLCKAYSDRIMSRGAASQIEHLFDADTLYSSLPIRENALFGPEVVKYRLDDYTRFPTMDEVFVEIIPELRSRKLEGATDIRVRLNDIYRTVRFVSGMSLMMVDGVPVFDQKRIVDYDPILVESVNVYPYEYFIGVRAYDGVANFVTYKKNAPSLEFDRNVRIVDFKGCSMPVAFTARGLGSDYPDYRQTVLWQPLVDLQANAKAELEAALPAYGGEFRVVVDGVAADGTPLHAETSFTLD